MARKTALARRKTASRGYGSKAAVQLRNARSALSRQRRKYDSSLNKAQYSQLAWTCIGGAGGGFASAQFPDGLMGIDPRLIGGVVLTAGCLMVKSDGISRPMCGVAAGLFASWLGETAQDMFSPDPASDEVV